MPSFLQIVISNIKKNFKNTSNSLLVLPSQRACVFIKNEFKKQNTKTDFLPKIISIEEFIEEISELSIISPIHLQFEFYKSYLENTELKKADSFENFMPWANTVLHDFNEIDANLINAKSILSNLSDIKKIDKWFVDKKPTEFSLKYISLFNNLLSYYTNLNKNLNNKGIGYQGAVYKIAVEKIEYYIQNLNYSHLFLIGFNALNKAEELLFQKLLESKKATAFWDTNDFILNTEAGKFLKKYKLEWEFYKKNPFITFGSNSFNPNTIEVLEASKNISQIKTAGNWLKKQKNLKNTAIVLADENMLPVMLNSLPKEVENINITMGYPIKNTPIFYFFEKLFKLHLGTKNTSDVEKSFYYKEVIAILSDSFLTKENKEIFSFIAKIKKENIVFISNQLINQHFQNNQLIQSIFHLPKSINNLIDYSLQLILKFKETTTSEIELAYLFELYNIFLQLQTLNKTYHYLSDLQSFLQVFKQIANNVTLSFRGEPLKGLQLMGMLETRVLDFEKVIITSLNEGFLPKGNSEKSFIPLDLKLHFGLPLYYEKDAIFAYHFYRLLQRAKQICLIYNTEPNQYGGGEKSRFLTQLQLAYPSIKPVAVTSEVKNFRLEENKIEKTKEVIQIINKVFEEGISPSALSTYIYNPISFYEQKILNIKEEEILEETIATNTMGTIIHNTLQELYTPFINKKITVSIAKNFKKEYLKILDNEFKKILRKEAVHIGKNKLIFEVCKKQINNFLNNEINFLKEKKELKIISLEKKYTAQLAISNEIKVNLKGYIDRVDEVEGVIRIIDYKTGMVTPTQLKINDFSVIPEDYKYTKALQVMFYAYLFTQNKYYKNQPLEAGVISFKNLKEKFIKMNFSKSRNSFENLLTTEKINEFLEVIKQLLLEIINKEKPFIENKNLPF